MRHLTGVCLCRKGSANGKPMPGDDSAHGGKALAPTTQ